MNKERWIFRLLYFITRHFFEAEHGLDFSGFPLYLSSYNQISLWMKELVSHVAHARSKKYSFHGFMLP